MTKMEIRELATKLVAEAGVSGALNEIASVCLTQACHGNQMEFNGERPLISPKWWSRCDRKIREFATQYIGT